LLLCSQPLLAEEDRWESPQSVFGAETISLQQARTLHAQGVKFIDVRSPRQYKKRHIPGAYHLYLKDGFSQTKLGKLVNADEPFVIYCNGRHCGLSYRAAMKAVDWGYTRVKYFRSGISAWRRDGNVVEQGMKEETSEEGRAQ
jgi:rhodanese-related sulfurtransferase